MTEKLKVGWREWLALPELGIRAVKAKVDTGARTSALHVFELDTFVERGRNRVRFKLHPLQRNQQVVVSCECDIVDERNVKDSGGHGEQRLVIRTPIDLGGMRWPIEITLTNREDMLFRMLLGRTAMHNRLMVDPAASYLCGRPSRKIRRPAAT